MTRVEIFKVVDKALLGLCKVRITFKQKEIGNILYLLRMKQVGMVNWDESENTNINELLQQASQYSYEFYSKNPPMIVILFTYKFDEWLFMEYLGHTIDAIEIVYKPQVL